MAASIFKLTIREIMKKIIELSDKEITIGRNEFLKIKVAFIEIDILTNSPKERYKRVLKRSPQLFQEIPNRHIANYLRMSAETLSRLKKS